MLPFDPVLLLIPAVVAFSAWMVYEHRRISDVQALQVASDASTQELNLAVDSLNTGLDDHEALLKNELAAAQQLVADLGTRVGEHVHPDLSPLIHDHTTGLQGHVHWLRYNSTELTDSKRRDVYVCLVPDCKAIFAHAPEV